MHNYERWELPVGTLEYYDDTHTYLFNGIKIPSITQILKLDFGNMYQNISPSILQRAAMRGTKLHSAIEEYEKHGTLANLIEFRNYIVLKVRNKWQVIESEIPVVLFYKGKPIAGGRIDQVIKILEEIGINDIKRTAKLKKDYVTMQTNLYRIAYRQTYGIEPSFLSVTHLREQQRKFIKLEVNENKAWDLVVRYLESENKNYAING